MALGMALVVWQGAANVAFADRRVFATPLEVLTAASESSAVMVLDVGATGGRVVLGLVLGVVSGLALGILAATLAERVPLLDRLLEFLRSLPPVAILPTFLLAFGFNDGARVLTVAFGCAWPMALAATTLSSAPKSARREMLDLAGFEAWRARLWTEPWESLPCLSLALRTSASTAVIVAVVTEMVAGSESGLGARLVSAQIANDTASLTASLLATGALGYVINLAFRALERHARRAGGLDRARTRRSRSAAVQA